MSADSLILAIDAGTGSCRAALFDSRGRQVAIALREYSHHAVPGVPNSQAFDTAGNWGLICDCIGEALASAAQPATAVAAVSATSMREGIVCYDALDREIWACPNVDARATDEVSHLVESGLADEIYALAGDWVSITAPARLLWIARHEPEVFASIAHIGMLGDWIIHRLSGSHVTDPSLGSSSGMFDLARRTWSPRILEICGITPLVCPEVVASGTVVGEITDAAARDTGLRPGTPVVAGGADTQLSLVGIGVADPGQFTVVGGSFWQQTVLVEGPTIDPGGRLRTLCHTSPDRWMIEGIGFYSGLAMRWFRDAFCAPEKEYAERSGLDVYHVLEREAAGLRPGANGVVGIFSNVMVAKRWVHAAPSFIGFDLTNSQQSGRGQCLRAIEESAAYVSYAHMQTIEEITGRPVARAVFTGGAANGKLWPQILADVLGVPVAIPEIKESSALGAALHAGAAVGVYPDVGPAAAEVVRFEPDVEPDPDSHAEYRSLYQRWLEIYDDALRMSDSNLTRALWRAPGT